MTMNGLHSNDDLHEETGGGGNGEDRLSELPDDVLLNILDRVCALDAVRTCLLSKRTLHLPAMLSRIAIDVYSLLPAAMEDDDLSLIKTTLARTNGWVSHATRRILGAKPPTMPIRSLKLRFFLRRDDCLSIGTSVAGAMAAHKVDAAEFKIVTEKDFSDCRDTDLRLYAKRFNTFLRVCPEAFTGLTRLHLENLRLREPDIANILATCGRLESLRLFECDAGVGSVMRVEHGRLIDLEISYGKFRTVELRWLPKLRRMVYDNWAFADEPLFFGFVPQLSKLSLGNAYLSKNKIRLSQLLVNTTSISDMHLDFQSEMIWVWPECPGLLGPVLGKLRRVNLDFLPKGCDIAWTLFFLEGAPSLEEMCLSVQDHWCGAETRRAHCKKRDMKWESSLGADFRHKNLARLTIYGFQSTHSFVRYVNRVMGVAVNIEEISLYDTKVCDFCTEEFSLKMDDCLTKYPRTSTKKDFLRERITEGLATTSPAMIHFRS